MARNTKTNPPGCYLTTDASNAVPLTALSVDGYTDWLEQQNESTRLWLDSITFKPEPANYTCLQTENGLEVLVIVGDDAMVSLAAVRRQLPVNTYQVTYPASLDWKVAVIGWVLDAYKFNRYLDVEEQPASKLVLDQELYEKVIRGAEAHYLVRDLINTPADDMGPTELSAEVQSVAKEHGADFSEVVGDDLLIQNYPAIHAVGRASDDAPRLLHLSWGDDAHPRIALVGKGVCFDTGGLDLKGSEGMRWMKKDMGGAAHVLGLAQWVMSAGLNVKLDMFISAVENNVSANAYRPGDVVHTRKGLTVEIGNTDAEGRVVLSDALARACELKPELILDFATLTGAARVALGADIAATFTDDKGLLEELSQAGDEFNDPIWPLPLYAPYKRHLASNIADLNNMSKVPYGGAITAALFLKSFVEPEISWCHMDLMAFNSSSSPGKPEGGEAMGLRACFQVLANRYG